MDWLTDYKIPVGKWSKKYVDFLIDYFYWLFDAISVSIEVFTEGMVDALLWFPDWGLVLVVTGFAAWLHKSWKLGLVTALGLLFIINQGYWEETIYTIALVICATFVSMAIGVPFGVAAAHRPKMWVFLRPVLDVLQTIPTFAYLVPALVLFGLGMPPGVIATVLFVIAAPIRFTYLGVSSVPKPLIEAAESFGATKRQLLWKVEIPHALPTILAGLTQCIMLSLSMAVIAAMVGAPGLGVPVIRALNTVNVAKGFEAGLVIAVVAILMDRICKPPIQTGAK